MFSVAGVDKRKLDAVFGNLVAPNAQPAPAELEGADTIAEQWGKEQLPIRPEDHEGDSDYDPDAIDMETYSDDEDGPCHSSAISKKHLASVPEENTPAQAQAPPQSQQWGKGSGKGFGQAGKGKGKGRRGLRDRVAGKRPDYERNPHKWTGYSLEGANTNAADMKAAAMSFLSDLKSKKSDGDIDMTDAASEKPVFRAASKSANSAPQAASGPTVRGGARVMEECVAGVKRKEQREKTDAVKASKSGPKLSCMDDSDEDL